MQLDEWWNEIQNDKVAFIFIVPLTCKKSIKNKIKKNGFVYRVKGVDERKVCYKVIHHSKRYELDWTGRSGTGPYDA